MQRRTKKLSCILAWPCIVLLLCSLFLPALAENGGFVEPKLPSDANTYDPEHPEDLGEDQLVAKSAILIEENTGEVIFEKNADEVMFPASTTKILTVLLGITIGENNGIMNDTVTASEDAVNLPEGSSAIPLSAGEEINFTDLLYATMVKSGNDGANMIAETISGSVPAFVDLMNQAAAAMGCNNTHFTNPHGLHDDNHYTTVRDMAIIAREAMKNSTFRQIASTTSYALPKSNLQRARTLNLDNPMMVPGDKNDYYYPYETGIKTGNTDQAGRCFVGSATKAGVSLISVVFFTSSAGRWTDTKKLMEYGFSQYMSVTPVELYNMNPIILETTGFSPDDPDLGKLPLNLTPMDTSATASIVATKSQVESMARNLQQLVIIEYLRDFRAPIAQGEQMGTLTYFPTDGGEPVEYALVASRAIASRENAPKSLQQIQDETLLDPNPFPRFSLEYAVWTLLSLAGLYLIYRIVHRLFRSVPGKGSDHLPKPTMRRFR